jgi:hypothetical protein
MDELKGDFLVRFNDWIFMFFNFERWNSGEVQQNNNWLKKLVFSL